MQSQLVAFLTKNNFLSVHQSGFRKKYSPETATVHFVDHILKQMDKQRITGCTFLILKKAFDLFDDHCLLHKLGNIMELESLKWFEDYLTTRTQKVKYNQNVSSSLGFGYRVPLGSILSPILCHIHQWSPANFAHDINRHVLTLRLSTSLTSAQKSSSRFCKTI